MLNMKTRAIVLAAIAAVSAFIPASAPGAEALERLPYLVLYKANPAIEAAAASIAESSAKARLLRELKAKAAAAEARAFSRANGAVGATAIASKETLWLLNATIARLSPQEADRVSALGEVERVVPLGRAARLAELPNEARPEPALNARRPLLDLAPASRFTYGLRKIRVPELNAQFPSLLGKGARVGVIDTGVDASHPDLAGKVVAFKDFVGKRKEPYDDHGHGTHVAGTIAGGGASGVRIGVAPEASILMAKAFGRFGGSDDAGLLLAMQWMADPDGDPATDDAPQTLSCSWNVDGDVAKSEPEREPFCQAIDRLKALGIVSVFAAGNDGPNGSSIMMPGACPNAITVGATDDEDAIADMSSRGPVRWRNGAIAKPDVAAPGIGIQSAAPGGSYARRSGTSMATPHAAAAIALLGAMRPEANLETRVRRLLSTAIDLGPAGPDPAFGQGRIDLLSAANAAAAEGDAQP